MRWVRKRKWEGAKERHTWVLGKKIFGLVGLELKRWRYHWRRICLEKASTGVRQAEGGVGDWQIDTFGRQHYAFTS